VTNEGDDEYLAYVRGRLGALHRLALALTGDPFRADDLV
jgi:hypothetical protein